MYHTYNINSSAALPEGEHRNRFSILHDYHVLYKNGEISEGASVGAKFGATTGDSLLTETPPIDGSSTAACPRHPANSLHRRLDEDLRKASATIFDDVGASS